MKNARLLYRMIPHNSTVDSEFLPQYHSENRHRLLYRTGGSLVGVEETSHVSQLRLLLNSHVSNISLSIVLSIKVLGF